MRMEIFDFNNEQTASKHTRRLLVSLETFAEMSHCQAFLEILQAYLDKVAAKSLMDTAAVYGVSSHC